MRFDLMGAVVLIGAGVILAVVGFTWHVAYNTEYNLNVNEVIQGKHTSWLAPGRKMARVTGLALRRQAERITVQTRSGQTGTSAERAFFPLRAGAGTAAILVSLPFEQFDPNVTLYDTADMVKTYVGVLERTPPSKGGPPIEQRFTDVAFPTSYCLVVGEPGGDRNSRWLGACGVAMAMSGLLLGLLGLFRHPGRSARAVAGVAHVAGPPAAVAPAGETPAEPSAGAAVLAEARPPSAADAMAAMAALVAEQASPDEDGPQADDPPSAGDDSGGEPGSNKDTHRDGCEDET